jgi:hypothetical protein
MSISVYFPPLSSGGSLPAGLTAGAGSTATLASETIPDGTTGTVLQLSGGGGNPLVATASADTTGGLSPWSGAFVIDSLTGGTQLLLIGIRADTPRNNDVGFALSFNTGTSWGLVYFRDNSTTTTLSPDLISSSAITWNTGHWYLFKVLPLSNTHFQFFLFDASAGKWLNSSGAFVTSSTPVVAGDYTDASAITGSGKSFVQIEAGISFLELASNDGVITPAPTYTNTAPTPPTGSVGVPSQPFTLQPTGGVAFGSVSASSLRGGSINVPFSAWGGTSTTRTYTVTESSTGTDHVSTTNTMGATNPAAAIFTVSDPGKVGQAQIDVTGTLLWLLITDQAGNPSNVTAVNTTPTITVNGLGGTTLTLLDWGVTQSPAPYLPYIVYQLSAPVAAHDLVIASFVDSWATAVVGNVGSGSTTALNLTGQATTIPTTVPSPRKTKAAVNIDILGNISPVMPMANIALQVADWAQGGITLDASGNVTSLGGNSFITALLVVPVTDPNDPSNNYAAYPQGSPTSLTTLQWTGSTSSAFFISETTGGAATVVSGPTTVNGVTTVVYNITSGPGLRSPGLQLGCQAAGGTNVKIYPPGISPTNPPTFHPEFMNMIKGLKCLRSMVALNTNNTSVVDYTDFCPTTKTSFVTQNVKYFGGTITSLAPYTVDNYFGTTNSNLAILITYTPTAGTTPIKEGQFVTLGTFTGGGPHGNGTFDMTNGGLVTPSGQIGVAHVISGTQFAITFAAVTGTAPYVLATTYSSGLGTNATVSGFNQYGFPPEVLVQLCNQNNSDLWINVPHPATDTCATTLFNMIATNLNRGLRVHVEYSNETWNNGAAFLQTAYCQLQGQSYSVGTGATLGTPVINGSGAVTSVPVTGGGSGYQYARQFTCTGGTLAGGGSTAYGFTVVNGSGQVTGTTIINPGSYVSGQGPTGATIGGLSGDAWYVLRANQLHNLAETALAAVGRGGDLVRVIGVQYGNPGGASLNRAQYAIVAGIPVDRVAGAPYFWAGIPETSLSSGINALTQPQTMSLAEYYMRWGADIVEFINANMSYWTPPATSAFPGIQFTCYEGGPDYGGLAGGNESERSQRWARDPRMFWIMYEFLNQLNSCNTDVFCDFTSWGVPANADTNIGNVANASMWPVQIAWNQQPGTGDGTDGQFNNTTNYYDLGNVVSVVGYALQQWNGVASSAPAVGGSGGATSAAQAATFNPLPHMLWAMIQSLAKQKTQKNKTVPVARPKALA